MIIVLGRKVGPKIHTDGPCHPLLRPPVRGHGPRHCRNGNGPLKSLVQQAVPRTWAVQSPTGRENRYAGKEINNVFIPGTHIQILYKKIISQQSFVKISYVDCYGMTSFYVCK